MKTLKLILKSLINNEATVEGGRHHPWWIALILFFLSMIISIVPIFVQTITASGSSFISSTTYGAEIGLQRFAEDANDKGLTMIVHNLEGGDNYINLEQDTWDAAYTYVDAYTSFHAYQHMNSDSNVDFEVYYVADLTNADITKIMSNRPVTNSETGEVTYDKRNTSFAVFGKNSVVAYIYNGISTSATGSSYGDYKSFEAGYNVLDVAKVTINDEVYTKDNITPELYNKYKEGVLNNWKNFFSTAYLWNRGQLTWRTTLLMFGINAALTIFMGFMIWILTRGKNNPFRIYTFMETQFISAWCALTPAILALALGFLISQFAQVIYPLLLGVRVMWLSMKTLRPEYASAPQQNQKTVKTVDVKSKK